MNDDDTQRRIMRLRHNIARERNVNAQASQRNVGYGRALRPIVAGPSASYGHTDMPDPMAELSKELEKQNKAIEEQMRKKRQLVKKLADTRMKKHEEAMMKQMEDATQILSELVMDEDERRKAKEAKEMADPQALQLQLMNQLVEQNRNLQKVIENGGSGNSANLNAGIAALLNSARNQNEQVQAADKVSKLKEKLKEAVGDGSGSDGEHSSGSTKSRKKSKMARRRSVEMDKWLDDSGSDDDYAAESERLQEELRAMRDKGKNRRSNVLSRYKANKSYPKCRKWRLHCYYILFCATLLVHQKERKKLKESQLGEVSQVIVSTVEIGAQWLSQSLELPLSTLLTGEATLLKGKGDYSTRLQVRLRNIIEELERSSKRGDMPDKVSACLRMLTIEGALIPEGFLLETEKKYVRISKSGQIMGMSRPLQRRLVINFLLTRCMLITLFDRPWEYGLGPRKLKSKSVMKEAHSLARGWYSIIRAALTLCDDDSVSEVGRVKLEREDSAVIKVIDYPISKEISAYKTLNEWMSAIAKRVVEWADTTVDYISGGQGKAKARRT